MYNYYSYANPGTMNEPAYNPYDYSSGTPMDYSDYWKQFMIDHGPQPFVVNIEEAAKQNNNYRLALWTGSHLQLTLMSIDAGDDIGVEIHPNTDQFLQVAEGQGIAMMGNSKDNLYFRQRVYENYAIFVPAGTWHDVVNTGCTPLKLYSIYAPPAHPHGAIQPTKKDVETSPGY